MDELDAWVIYGRIADAALAIESLVYTPPFGDMAVNWKGRCVQPS